MSSTILDDEIAGTVVSLTGMRINSCWSVQSWFPVFGEMSRMLRELVR